jgi:hypothetical protein
VRLFFLLPALAPAAFAQQTPAWEFFGGYSFQRSSVREYYKSTPTLFTFREQYINLNGWEFAVTENVKPWLGGTFQLDGHYKSPDFRGSKNRERIHSILYGPRFSHRAGWGTAYAHMLFGAARASVTVSPGPHPHETSFAATAGAGLDLNLGKKAAVRVLQLQYSPTNPLASKNHRFQASAGMVFYVGQAKK